MQALETLSREEFVVLLYELMQRIADLEKENAQLRTQLDKKGRSSTPHHSSSLTVSLGWKATGYHAKSE